MNTANIARNNFNSVNCTSYYAPKCPSFTNPNTKNGYGAIIKLLSRGSQPSRKVIVNSIGLSYTGGTYSTAFQSLLWSGLISYDRNNGYMLTDLGSAYASEYNLK
jgi:Mn-dependent DtxR family transcriptional regulator